MIIAITDVGHKEHMCDSSEKCTSSLIICTPPESHGSPFYKELFCHEHDNLKSYKQWFDESVGVSEYKLLQLVLTGRIKST